MQPQRAFRRVLLDSGSNLRPGTLRDGGWGARAWRQLDDRLAAAVGGLGESDLHGSDEVRLSMDSGQLLQEGR